MRRMIGAVAVGLAAAAAAAGHELYVVPDGGDPGKITIVFGHGVKPDKNVKPETWKKFEGLKLSARGADGAVTEVKWEKAEHCFKAAAPAGSRVVFGQVDYGVSTRAGGKPTLVRYYPKAVVVGVPADGGKTDAAFQLVPVAEAGKVRFRVLAGGKPAAGVTVEVTAPEKDEPAEATTDADGLTPAFEGVGRFLAAARRVEVASGESNGQKYEQVSHVATLVADVK
jgi:hypothetical protein